MTERFFHGARVEESSELTSAINDIDSNVIGIVAVADDANATMFPLNTPVLITRVNSVLSKTGKTGTLYKALKAIADQCSPRVIVVRVAAASGKDDDPSQDDLVVGGEGVDSSYTGVYSLLAAEQRTGCRPRILAAPGLDTERVTKMLCYIAQKLRAFVYASCHGCETIKDALKYRMQMSSRELMLIWPDFIAPNPRTGEDEIFPAPAYACAMRALIDNTRGWHKSLSNVPVKNVRGISRDVSWSLQDENSDAIYLNDYEVTTLIKRDGFRFWGNRTTDTYEYIFEVYTRTAQILADSIAEAQFTTIDSPLTPENVKDVLSGIRGHLSRLVTAKRLIGAECWYDTLDNTTVGLRQGQLRIRYKYTPVPPLEDLKFFQTFTDEYFEPAFASLGGE